MYPNIQYNPKYNCTHDVIYPNPIALFCSHSLSAAPESLS